jgi:hypothetical protein
MDDKIIVSNRTALTAKYGAAGVQKIKQAVNALIAADAKRGIKSRLVYLDDAVAMKSFKGKAVTIPVDPRQNKEAIDAIFKSGDPDYLVILGSIDVVPHQDMANPVFAPQDDPDKFAYGDLPYACETPYSRDIATFKGPTRVVGRLPDLTNQTKEVASPSHLISLLRFAETFKSRPAADYAAYFGMSTFSWRKSSELSLTNVFGNSSAITIAPPGKPPQPKKRLSPLSHFINCHGASADPEFFGEKGNSQPVSYTSKDITKKISTGTVAAMECCYGAELYDSVLLGLPLPICQQYLIQGAHGYFGSSTIAYGPAEGNGAADLIAQYFLREVLKGASIGRAALTARQQFVSQVGELDPVDLKTLAQFNLLGDPSVVPAVVPSATSVPKSADTDKNEREGRHQRRAKARVFGQMLQDTKPTASKKASKVRKSPTVSTALRNIAKQAGIGTKRDFMAFKVKTPKAARLRGSKAVSAASRYYVAVYKPGEDKLRVAAVAKEVSGRIVGYRIYTEK